MHLLEGGNDLRALRRPLTVVERSARSAATPRGALRVQAGGACTCWREATI